MARIALAWIGIYIFGVISISQAATSSIREPKRLHRESHGYSITVPRGWVRIPKSELNMMSSAAFTDEVLEAIDLDLAFQKRASEWFAHPYVIVQIQKYPNGRQPGKQRIRQFLEEITGIEREDVDKMLKKGFREIITDLEKGRLEFSPKEKTYTWEFRIRVPEFGTVHGYSRGHFGRKSVIMVTCCALEGDFKKYKPTFLRIQESFAFDPGLEYLEIEWYESNLFAIVLIIGAIATLSFIFRHHKS